MEYRRLGATGLKVSAISYGNWVNSDDQATQDRNTQIIQKAWELGINFFDTAEVYGEGKAEIHLGHALKTLNVQRQDIVISTKIFGGDGNDFPNSKYLSRKHIIEGLRNSLKRLDTPYVDIVFAHRYDYSTPLEETCRAFDWVIRHGLAHYWGTSEWTAQQIHQAIGICDKLSLHKPVVEQPQYNMMVRDRFEWEYESVFAAGYGSTIWSPLYQGLLTGKYNEDILADGRFKNSDNVYVKLFYQQILGDPEKRTKIQNQLKQLGEIAKELGVTQAQLSLAWALKNKDVSTAITSATKPEQLEETVKSVQVIKLITKEVEQKIESILSNKPTTSLNFKQMAPYPTRRDLYI
ncbi:unnamed protein product [Paramecium primaurelia]|uniref:NADP-dependent oxidoreductase domain-containing protein n=2 Tax=Paramecium TaxID=5884 RepID=A0A8S1XSL3_9CILI|nr:unnamed protein product [Paramecium primaurelia]CAD8204087.1 unnamed protein product [Paramecium pentaurelia]